MKKILLFFMLSCFKVFPIEQTVLSTDPQVVVFHQFLSDDECDHLIREAEPFLQRSTVVDNNSYEVKKDKRRTSRGMFFPFITCDPIILNIEERIAQITSIPQRNGESIQVLHYSVWEEYQPHYDYFDMDTVGGRYQCQRGGQRRATFLMYLNTPELGGETVFPKLKIKVKPVKGDALLFYNCNAKSDTDPRTLHGGAPVITGEKWIATKWLRLHRFK